MRRLLMTGMASLLAAALVVVDAAAGLARPPAPTHSHVDEGATPSQTQDDEPELSAVAAALDGITLEASADTIPAGQQVTLSGEVSPPSEGVEVSIVRARDSQAVGPPLTTAADGAFSTTLSPRRSITFKALAEGFESEPVSVTVLSRRVTLKAARRSVTIRRSVRLRGAVSPRIAGQEVAIVRLDTDKVVRTLSTNSKGRFSTRLMPRRTRKYQARVDNARSKAVRIGVRALASITMRRVNLFGRALVEGSVRPSSPGGRVKITVLRNGKELVTKRPRLRDGRHYRARFFVPRPGSYRARVVFDDPGHLAGRGGSGSKRTSLPSLSEGSTGASVKRLEARLRSLGYYLPSADRTYTHQTHDAVLAFNKVEGRARVGNVEQRTWRALADARRPRARSRSRGFHIEVDQTRQVLYMVRNRRVRRILHVSTGGAGVGVTRDGRWRVHRRLAGFSPGRLYYPSYFDGLRAIHGWPEVPPTPASHGCVRVPMWAARWIFDQTRIGTVVNIYHS